MALRIEIVVDLDVDLLFAIWMGQIQSKLMDWPVFKLQVCNLVFDKFVQPVHIAKSK